MPTLSGEACRTPRDDKANLVIALIAPNPVNALIARILLLRESCYYASAAAKGAGAAT
jgi:hypothetical protein